MKRKTDSEHEQQEISRLMPTERKKRPSRKYTETRAPRDDVRRRRIKPKDDDLNPFDEHLSMGQKYASDLSWHDMHERYAAPYELENVYQTYHTKIIKELSKISQAFVTAYTGLIEAMRFTVGESSPISTESVKYERTFFRTWYETLSYYSYGTNPIKWDKFNDFDHLTEYVLEIWDSEKAVEERMRVHNESFGEGSKYLGGSETPGHDNNKKLILKVLLRASFLAKLYEQSHDKEGSYTIFPEPEKLIQHLSNLSSKKKEEYIRQLNLIKMNCSFLFDELHDKPVADKSTIETSIEGFKKKVTETVNTVTAVVTAYQAETLLTKMFSEPDVKQAHEILRLMEEDEIQRDLEKFESVAHKYQAQSFQNMLNLIEKPISLPKNVIPLEKYLDDLSVFLKANLENDAGWKQLLVSIESLQRKTDKTETETKELKILEEKVEEVYSKLDRISSFGRTASQSLNREWKTRMDKTAAYQGVLEQGHPEGPTNTPWLSIDKRYIDSDHLKTIVSCAKNFMDSDWFKTGWDYGAAEAKYRAALDLAIATCENSIYQSKIDAPTYDILLNNISGNKVDVFTDTLIPDNNVRKASEIPGIIRLASAKLRESDNEISNIAASRILNAGGSKQEIVDNVLIAADLIQNDEISNRLIKYAADLYASTPVEEIKMAETTRIAMDLDTIVKVAYENPKARETLLPIIAAAKKKAMPKKKSSKKEDASYASDKKDEVKKSSVKEKTHSEAPKKLTKTTGSGKKVRKASDLSISDTEW